MSIKFLNFKIFKHFLQFWISSVNRKKERTGSNLGAGSIKPWTQFSIACLVRFGDISFSLFWTCS